MAVENLITEHIDIWTSAVKTKSTSGRGSSKKLELYGVKKLRDLILELAVRGKLVPQDPNDEPASDLLVESLKEKDALIKKGIVKKSRSKKTIKEEHFYDYPASWVVSRLEDLINVVNGRAYKKAEMLSEGTPILRVGNLFTSNDWYYSDLQLEADKYIDNGDLIYAWSASFGPFIWDGGKVIYHYHIWKMDIFRETSLDKEFSKLFLQAISERIKASGNGIAMIHMTKERMEKVMHPLPPINEQKQIVNRVNKLMTLCDQLEQQTEDSIEAHQVLVTTLLDTLTNSADADELMQNWARISEHFDTLFTTEESIDQLKQTILQLAVMGALSQPLNSDTSIDVHLDNILEQQKQLATAKEYSLIEAEVLKAKNEISNNRVVLKARCFCNFITKGTTPSKNELLETGDVPFLKVYNIVNNELDFDYRPIFISNEVHTSKLKRSIAHPGDVIMNIVGPPLGKVAVLSEQYPQWNMNQALAVFKPVSSVFNRYLYYVLSCELTLRSVLSEVKGTAGQDNLSLEQCRDLLVPIMSIQEQQRLVCLVDSLWDYCDRLKKRMKSSQKTQLHLTDAVTGQAV